MKKIMDHIYCLSGLGADQRIFKNVEIPETDLLPLDWVLPQQKQEPLNDYAKRLALNIKHEQPVLLGVSFGGMMAIEIAKLIPVKAVILISSIKSSHELPLWMKLFGKCKAEYLLPTVPLKSIRQLRAIRPIQNYFLGANTPEAVQIANEFRDNVDPLYLKWSVRNIFNWKNEWNPPQIFHIHGDNDKLFPISKVKPTHVIKNGGHFMVMSHGDEINKIITEICSGLNASPN
ncbi:MAG: alpha/beta hydrolase [Chitinophagaceae bacterium]|nr:MAG: alpha/beta hydrolase [Chitinophagaceae bacterium]